MLISNELKKCELVQRVPHQWSIVLLLTVDSGVEQVELMIFDDEKEAALTAANLRGFPKNLDAFIRTYKSTSELLVQLLDKIGVDTPEIRSFTCAVHDVNAGLPEIVTRKKEGERS